MRVYEELFILKPDAPEEEVDAFVDQIKQVISTGKGTVDKVDKWGMRKLAYRVQKYNEGLYVLVQFSSSPELVQEVERRMRVTDMVIKFITVRIDEKLKKIEKRKKARDKRAARRPPRPRAAAPAAPGCSGPGWRSRTGASGTMAAGIAGHRADPASGPAVAGGADEGKEELWPNQEGRKTNQRVAAAHRRRQGDRGQETIFPAQEGVPVLRRQNRRHQLQGRAAAELLHFRARQDHAAAHFGRVRAAPAAAGGSDQAGAEHRADAVLRGDVGAIYGSHSQRRHR